MITTNVRMTEQDMARAREMAQEMGMSFNKYINWLIRGGDNKNKNKKNKMSFLDIAQKKVKNDRPMGLSKDDEIIYG